MPSIVLFKAFCYNTPYQERLKHAGGQTISNYESAMALMSERFGKDNLTAMATFDGDRLYNRVVDAYFCDGAFYISTHALSSKVKQNEANPRWQFTRLTGSAAMAWGGTLDGCWIA